MKSNKDSRTSSKRLLKKSQTNLHNSTTSIIAGKPTTTVINITRTLPQTFNLIPPQNELILIPINLTKAHFIDAYSKVCPILLIYIHP